MLLLAVVRALRPWLIVFSFFRPDFRVLHECCCQRRDVCEMAADVSRWPAARVAALQLAREFRNV